VCGIKVRCGKIVLAAVFVLGLTVPASAIKTDWEKELGDIGKAIVRDIGKAFKKGFMKGYDKGSLEGFIRGEAVGFERGSETVKVSCVCGMYTREDLIKARQEGFKAGKRKGIRVGRKIGNKRI
jgi:hypothetical protein